MQKSAIREFRSMGLEGLPRRKIRLAAYNGEAWNGSFSMSKPLFFPVFIQVPAVDSRTADVNLALGHRRLRRGSFQPHPGLDFLDCHKNFLDIYSM